MFLRRTIPAFVAVSLALALAGCAKGPQVMSIAITPATGVQVITGTGQTAQYTAIATFKQSTHPAYTQNVTDQVTWGSTADSVATINAAGLATTTGSGITTITATYGGAIGTSDLTVTVPTGGGGVGTSLTGITIYPGPGAQTVYAPGDTAQFVAVGTYSSSPVTRYITNSVSWQSAAVDIATINSSGLATAVNCTSPANPPLCTTVITATCLAATPGCDSITDVVGTSSLTLEAPSVPPTNQLPSLEVYAVGGGNGSVISTPAGVSCTITSGIAPPGCTGYFTAGSSVTLNACVSSTLPCVVPANFGGWSANCTPSNAPTCTVPMTGSQAVGVIFNPAN